MRRGRADSRRIDLFGNDIWGELFLEHIEQVQFERSVRIEKAWRDVEPEGNDNLLSVSYRTGWAVGRIVDHSQVDGGAKVWDLPLTFSLGLTSPVD
jgi:hypothetical protein